MGFLTGFFGGFTLTTSILYITLYLHQTNRQYQHALLREQIDILNSLGLPATGAGELRNGHSASAVMERRGYYLRGRPGVVELAKAQWNRELEALVRSTQEVTWADTRKCWGFMERMLKSLWGLVKGE